MSDKFEEWLEDNPYDASRGSEHFQTEIEYLEKQLEYTIKRSKELESIATSEIKELTRQRDLYKKATDFYADAKNIEIEGTNLAGKLVQVDFSEFGIFARAIQKEIDNG